MKNKFSDSVRFQVFPRIEMHQRHQLHGRQFIFVKTCSDKDSSDGFIKAQESSDGHGFIKANQKKTEVIDGELSKSYRVYQAVF